MARLTAAMAAVFLAANAFAADAKDELAGKWEVVSLERGGKADDALKGAVREQADGKYTMTPKNGNARTGTYTVDASAKPKQFDQKPAEGRYKGQTMQGIYELDGDTLKVCFGEPGKERPKELAAKEGYLLVVFKRVK